MGGRYVALDIGGTKLLVASADTYGSILNRVEASTPTALHHGLETIHNMIAHLLGGEQPIAIGAAIGGPLDHRTGVVSPLHQPEWRNVRLKQLMEHRYGCPFSVDVDTNVAALGEYHTGERRSPLLYLTVSTGMGGGLIVDGKIYRGANQSHPEPGHVHLQPGARCACGADGCLEAYISGRGILNHYRKPPEELTAEEWHQVASHLGFGLRSLATTYAPAVIVLGGGIAIAQATTLIPIASEVMAEGLRLVPHPEVRLTALGRDSALLGALALAMSS